MVEHAHSRRLPTTVAGVAAALLLGVLLVPGRSEARGGAAAGLSPNQRLGARLYEQALAWVAGDGAAPRAVRDLAVDGDLDLDLAGRSEHGPVRCWWKAPDRLRLELGPPGRATTKLLDGAEAWVLGPAGRTRRLHGTPEGAPATRQLRADARRIGDLVRWITLRGLRGPGVTFTFEGERQGAGAMEGRWLKLVRRAPDARELHLWLAYERDGAGRFRATWPGLIRIRGDRAQGVPDEDWILRGWSPSPPAGSGPRVPREIEGHTHDRGATRRFLRLVVRSLAIDAGVADARFRPPGR